MNAEKAYKKFRHLLMFAMLGAGVPGSFLSFSPNKQRKPNSKAQPNRRAISYYYSID